MNPLSRNFRDWLYAFALVGMLLRVSMPLWALPQMSEGGFMLLCTSQGIQWQLGEEGKGSVAAHQLPCVQCGAHLASLQSFPFTPPPPPVAAPERLRFAEALNLSPLFLVAPPGRAPPAIS
ncbi:hypothetical protein [Aquipseudomonas alcaligenes]|uniref:DUF2946 domain-containing protein n=1 Tax=Aquipseudomonas alcaligenes TaxID=43263 RepID=A0AA42N2W1_AQUAC|nr:hypothetical protein [Pseudomonas alcaligenes]MDH1055720.1 hypothetical protein [Pseudomonas alcaligenes]